MKPPAWGLYIGLLLIGAVVGFLLTELLLGAGNGTVGAAVFGGIGLLLAWMILRTRPNYTPQEIAAAMAEREAREAAVRTAQQSSTTAGPTIQVVKTEQPTQEQE